MLKNKLSKTDKTIIFLFFVYFVVTLIIFLPGYIKRKYEKLYLVGNEIQIKYENGKWSNIIDSSDYSLKKFDVINDKQYLGNYKVLFNNRLLLYENGKKVDYDGDIIAYRGTLKFKLSSYNYNEAKSNEDDFIIKKALNKVKISEDAFYSIDQKVFSDVDNDGNNETIYNISNIKQPDSDAIDCVPIAVSNSSNVNYSIIFIYKNNDVKIINSIVDVEQVFENFQIYKIVDIRADGKKELLYTKGYPLNPSSECLFLYNLSKEKQINNFCE